MAGYEDGRKPHPTAISVAAEYAYHLHRDDGMPKAEAIRVAVQAVLRAGLFTPAPIISPTTMGVLSAIGLVHALAGA